MLFMKQIIETLDIEFSDNTVPSADENEFVKNTPFLLMNQYLV